MDEASGSLLALTGLRFFAAVHVVFFHYADAYMHGIPAWLRTLAHTGNVGVGLFFILSGFILAYRYLGPDARALDRRAFWAARVARIYPVFLLSLIVATVSFYDWKFAGAGAFERRRLLTQVVPAVLTLTHAWSVRTYCVWNCPSWTLSVEAFFYAVFPLLALGIVGLRRRGLMLAMGVAWALTLVQPLTHVASPFHPLARLPEFVLGVVLGCLYSRRKDARRTRQKLFSIAGLMAAVALLVYLSLAAHLPDWAWDGGAPLSAGFALLIYSLAAGAGPLKRFLSQRHLVRLGEASYALYILQAPLWEGALVVLSHLNLHAASHRWYFCVYLVLLIGSSLATYRWIEIPARDWLRARLSRPRRRPVLESSPS